MGHWPFPQHFCICSSYENFIHLYNIFLKETFIEYLLCVVMYARNTKPKDQVPALETFMVYWKRWKCK